MEETLVFNGIDALTGDYLYEPITDRELAERIRQVRRDWEEERELRWWHEQYKEPSPDRRPAPDVDPLDLASSGWGVIFPQGTSSAVRKALRPLLEHRRAQAARVKEHYYQEIEYQPGESKRSFFQRLGVEPGPAHPEQLPYYLLIVGDPTAVPHRFQYLLDMQYAVGRLHFDNPDDYRRYAESVIESERGQSRVHPEMRFFAVRHDNDAATQRAAEHLIKPLLDGLTRDRGEAWKIRSAEHSGKAELGKLLGGGETPALLFTSAHGLSFPSGHELQLRNQGAILCQEWPGPRTGPVDRSHYFAADDVGDDARLHGLVVFLFGCYGAGTPHMDNYPSKGWRNPIERAPRPFLSALAQRLLSHPQGGALAVLGHIDRTWSRSFGSGRGKGYLHIEALLKHLLDGYPVGLAMDWMHERFAELSTELTDVFDDRKEPLNDDTDSKVPAHVRLANLWRANNDARNFVVLGDPAVYLAAGPRAARAGMSLPRDRSIPVRQTIERTPLREILGRLHTRDTVHPSISPVDAVRAERDRKEG